MAVDVSSARLSPEEVLEFLPQQEPFRFVDEILEVDEDHIVARYRFRPDADFFRGHFPGDPITPGVILLESLAQVGVVALGIYIYALKYGREGVNTRVALFLRLPSAFRSTSFPSNRTSPPVGCSRAASILRRVDFPEPLGPKTVITSPLSISRVISRKASVSPYLLETSRSSIILEPTSGRYR